MEKLNTFDILEDAGIGVFELDLVTGISVASPAWKRMIGLDVDEEILAQEEWLSRVHPDDLETVQAEDAKMFAREIKRSKVTFRFRHEDGEWIWIQSDVGITEWGENNKPLKMVGLHTDVTDFVMREKSKDDYLAMISHELRTPLTSILGALKMANSGQLGELPGPIGNLMQLAQRNSNRLLHMVNEILDFKSIESGEMHYDLEKVNVRDAAADAVLSMQGYIQDGQKISVAGEPGDDPIYINADVNRLQQILANLMSNAIKFSPAESEIELGLNIKEGQVEFAVRDHGPGVPDELEGKMFQRFTQAHTTGKKKFKSTGLGLSICKQMTEGMDGEIGYFNNEDGGATFWARFPLVS
ncbi:PAS domain-containing sensor histidine kinase [Cognatishimia sp. D5M38]|uniref:histidine kinase n=2 Tax=Cognatishimia TaxID=2211635 RepID=A0A975EP48_9RHOB|nr:PAS domain-containing sensor histidine kinase [Cognatishimia activa]QTN35554.1 PAS domain-containing sensor histidine kinase [Cognatishimia activa]